MTSAVLAPALDGLAESVSELPAALKMAVQDDAVLIVVDMVNGFIREGILRSPRIEAIVPAVKDLMVWARDNGIPIIAFADSHPVDSVEFAAYPPHCIEGTSEAELVDELKEVGGYTLVPKNSTNGFIEPAFQTILEGLLQKKNFIIVGDCTDICVMQLALSLKAHFTRINKAARIIVPENAVATFDTQDHNGDLMQTIALAIMRNSGIEVVARLA